MRKYLKETSYMYIITFVLCFMLFLYEPLSMYLNNISDFWFGISTMFSMSFKLFLLVFIPMVIGFNIIFFINKKVFKIFVLIMFVVFICTYIQGNFLVGNLPLLDGTKIEWSNYKIDWIISGFLWIIVIGTTVFLVKKFNVDTAIKYSGYVGLGIFVMISLSFLTTYLSVTEAKEKDFVPLVTYKNINKYSENKNIIVFLLDCVDSKAFYKRLKADDDFEGMLNDFTYYPDTMSGHQLTAESIPYILTGKFYKNDGPFIEWATDAYKDSYLFDLMEKNQYELDIYEQDILYNDKSSTRISNVYDNTSNDLISKTRFWKNELKYILFKYLPSFLKRFSKIDEMHFTTSYLSNDDGEFENRIFSPTDEQMLDLIKSNEIVIDDSKIFKFIHLEGAHAPWTLNKELKRIDNGSYEDEIDASLTLTKEYLKMLKANNIYDNSAIIIMADHGFSTDENGNQRQNPIFFVKGVNEKQKSMQISNKPLHFSDLESLFNDLLQDKKTNDLFKDVPNNRTRSFISYDGNDTSKMIEYETKNKVWEFEKAYKTGKEYIKKR